MSGSPVDVDVVVAGGGIAGSGAAVVLARAGLSVCVVEPTETYPDLVRGEWMAPWGVAHAQSTGLHEVLLAAGGHHIAEHITYDAAMAGGATEPIGLDGLLPGVPGPLCLRHPVACQALADEAVRAGATLHRGATDIELHPGPALAFVAGGAAHEVRGRIAIGADGRASAVRKAIGIELDRLEHDHFLAGLLLDGVDFLGEPTRESAATEGDFHALCFPQGGGRARVYLNHDVALKDRFGGRDRTAAYLAALPMACWPGSEGFAGATVAGPARGYRSVDTWCETPYAEGVVLLGDAAGHNDPLIGQGLSITMADIRGVTEALLGSDTWGPDLFVEHGRERAERMRRLRATARVYALATAGRYWAGDPDARSALQADPVASMVLATNVVGPYLLPGEIYDQDGIDRLVAGPPG